MCFSLLISIHLFHSISQKHCWRQLFWHLLAALCSMASTWQLSTLHHRLVLLHDYMHQPRLLFSFFSFTREAPKYSGNIGDFLNKSPLHVTVVACSTLSDPVVFPHHVSYSNVGLHIKSSSCCVPHHVIDINVFLAFICSVPSMLGSSLLK